MGYSLVFIFLDPAKKVLLTSNELGDFLAGVFAPLAFLFLYLGYKQQGFELQQNTQALNLQAAELKNSVEQQRLLVEAATDDLNFAKNQYADNSYRELIKSQPFIHLEVTATKYIDHDLIASHTATNDDMFNKIEIDINFYNSRTLAREVSIKILHQGATKFEMNKRVFAPDSQMSRQTLRLNYPNIFQVENPYVLDILFTYLDEVDRPQFQKFLLEVSQNKAKREQGVIVHRGETSFGNDKPN
ncbi:hypothetical protein OHW12_15595 [Acinetobacter baumannii]|nr:hypothetical protein [Acinetobacter baumannii]